MADSGVFKCPSCGAALKVDGDASQVECPYCGNTVIVPPRLRPPQPDPPTSAPQHTTVIVVQPPPQPAAPTPPVADKQARLHARRFDLGPFALWVLAALFFIPFFVGVVLLFTNPRLFAEWTRTSYGRLEASFGGRGEGPGQFTDPAGVAVDGEGTVYVLEYGSGRVQRFDGAGKLQGSWSMGQYSQCIAADHAGNVYVGTGSEVVKYEGRTGKQLDRLDFATPGDYVESLAVSPDGGLVLAHAGTSDAIVRLNSALQETGRMQGLVTKQSGSREALGLAVDGTGQIYALGKTSNEIFKFSTTGGLLARFGAGIQGSAYAVAIDAEDRLFVSDEKYIQVYDGAGSYLGRVTMPNNSGPANALAFGPRNELYALSMQSSMVYKFALAK